MTTKLEPRIWKHTFLRGEDEAELRRLRSEAEQLRPKKGEDATAYNAAVKAANAFAKKVEKNGTEVILRTIGSRKKMRQIKDACPVRDGNEDDKTAGYDIDAYAEALVSASLASPALPDGEREEFLDSLTEGEFELLAIAALQLHQTLGGGPSPKDFMQSVPTAT